MKWIDVASADMRRPGNFSYLDSYARNTAPPTGRQANGNNSSQYVRAGQVMGKYPNADAFNSTNPDFSELSYLGSERLADLAGRSWGESIMWNHVFCSDPWGINHTPGWVNNTRVVWWDWQFWIRLKSTGLWVLHQSSNTWSGVPVVPTFESEDWSKTWEDMRTEPSGYRSVRLMYDPNAKYASQGAGYWPYHGFSGGVKFLSASGIGVNDIAECVVSAKVSLVLHNVNGVDDRDFSRFAISIGADWYPTPRVFIYPGLGTSRHKLATAKWPNFEYIVFHTGTDAAIKANYPPVYASAFDNIGDNPVEPPPPTPSSPAPSVGNWFTVLSGGVGNWETAAPPVTSDIAPVWGVSPQLSPVIGVPFTYTAEVISGTPTPTYSKVSGPSWLSVSSAGVITGTAPEAGEFDSLVVRATNAAGSADAGFPILVFEVPTAPTITTTFLPIAVVNREYNAVIEATGTPTITLELLEGTLPGGLSIVGTAIQGMPVNAVEAGTYSITLKAVNSYGFDTQAYSLLFVNNTSSPDGNVNITNRRGFNRGEGGSSTSTGTGYPTFNACPDCPCYRASAALGNRGFDRGAQTEGTVNSTQCSVLEVCPICGFNRCCL